MRDGLFWGILPKLDRGRAGRCFGFDLFRQQKYHDPTGESFKSSRKVGAWVELRLGSRP